jgi:quercetin dioxygenase-like cupin family protein
MAARGHEEIERGVLSFRRENIDEGVHVARVALAPGQTSTFHHHTSTSDTFYVTSGCLSVTIRVDPSHGAPQYRALCANPPRAERLESGHEVLRFDLLPGDVLVVLPHVVHAATNIAESPCGFLCIEGVGPYEFIPTAQ